MVNQRIHQCQFSQSQSLNHCSQLFFGLAAMAEGVLCFWRFGFLFYGCNEAVRPEWLPPTHICTQADFFDVNRCGSVS